MVMQKNTRGFEEQVSDHVGCPATQGWTLGGVSGSITPNVDFWNTSCTPALGIRLVLTRFIQEFNTD